MTMECSGAFGELNRRSTYQRRTPRTLHDLQSWRAAVYGPHMDEFGDVVDAARHAVRRGHPSSRLEPLKGGLLHDVFKADAGLSSVAVKVYRSWERGEPDREWQALCALADLELGPKPLSFSAAAGGEPPVVVMGWVPGHSRGAVDINSEHLAAIVNAHRAVHGLSVVSAYQAQADP